MRKRLQHALLLAICILVIPVFAAAEIEWVTSYDQAMRKAERLDRNVFVLITAPSWCGPCQMLEAETMIDPAVIQLLNEEYVSLRVLDVVDGKRNPELTKFSFGGYPTMFVYNTDEEPLTTSVGFIETDQFLRRIGPFTDPDYDPSDHFITFEHSGGVIRQVSLDRWIETKGQEEYSLQEVQRDNHIYLFDPEREIHIAIPQFGGAAFFSSDKGTEWQPYAEVELE
jgi:thiol-disulfide isomerase/thioredoxin